MAYSEKDKQNHIRELQNFLRIISNERDIPFVIPDGYYGPATTAAVEEFQRQMSLPVTGSVDRATWDALRNENDRIILTLTLPRSISPAVIADFPMGMGSAGDAVLSLQMMIESVARGLADFPKQSGSGVFDDSTEQGVIATQLIFGMPPTGVADKSFWDMLSDKYNTSSVEKK